MTKVLITIGQRSLPWHSAASPAVTASAAPVPVIYGAGWSNPAVRPHWVIIGQGAPVGAHQPNPMVSGGAISCRQLFVAPLCASTQVEHLRWFFGWDFEEIDRPSP